MEDPATPLLATGTRAHALAGEHRAYLARRYFGGLDGLRCVCIAGVIWHHAGPRWEALPGSQRGYLGVDMFFVISGFLIVTLLLRERAQTSAILLRNFYVRRTLRIFPAYYAMLLGVSLLGLLVFPGSKRSALLFAELPWYVTYTSNWAPVAVLPLTWSLATEEQFYLLWPLVEKYVRHHALFVLAAVLALSQAMNFGRGSALFVGWFGPTHAALPVLQVTFTPICLGVALAHLLHSPAGFARFRRVFGAWGMPLALAVLTVLAANLPNEDISGPHRLALHVLMALLLGSCVVREQHALQPLLSLPPVQRTGIVSYGMYLYHIFAQHSVEAVLGVQDALLAFALCFALTWGIAELSFRLFEARFLQLKVRFSNA